MICITIGKALHRQMIAEHKQLVEKGAQLVELRTDLLRSSVNVGRLLNDRPGPVIFSCRRKVDGGHWAGTEEERIMLLRNAVVSGADYVEIDANIAEKIPRYGTTKRIISYHNLTETPGNLNLIHKKILEFDPDIIKIATVANVPGDMLRSLKLCLSKACPTVAFCMGEKGIPSRILCRKYGAPFSYASMQKQEAMSPGELTVREMINRYSFNKINANTRILGVIGDPVDNAFAPPMHNANLQQEGLDFVYLPFRVAAEDLNAFIDFCAALNLRGLSVERPHKEGVLRAVKALDDDVYGVRACNTVVFRKDRTYGYNTDCRAGLISLARAIGRSEEERNPFEGATALVLGSGSIAKAMAYGLLRGGASVLISSRNNRTAEDIAAHIKCFTYPWEMRHNAEFNFLINCTPVGMHPDAYHSPFDARFLRSNMVVLDAVYNPENTKLMRHAKEVGCEVVSGTDMFVYQTALQFEMFTGRKADIGLLRRVFRDCVLESSK
jgi:3-dehydroquinate dehydratase/shikimate dehydrogenase